MEDGWVQRGAGAQRGVSVSRGVGGRGLQEPHAPACLAVGLDLTSCWGDLEGSAAGHRPGQGVETSLQWEPGGGAAGPRRPALLLQQSDVWEGNTGGSGQAKDLAPAKSSGEGGVWGSACIWLG